MVANLFYVELFVDKQNAAEQRNRTRLSTFFDSFRLFPRNSAKIIRNNRLKAAFSAVYPQPQIHRLPKFRVTR